MKRLLPTLLCFLALISLPMYGQAVSYTHLDVYKRQLVKVADHVTHILLRCYHLKLHNRLHKDGGSLVSYTHLDVYKRQAENSSLGVLCIGLGMLRYHIKPLDAVSYTHLDVYKRQSHARYHVPRAHGRYHSPVPHSDAGQPLRCARHSGLRQPA